MTAILLVALAAPVIARGECSRIEYAELKDLSKKDLNKEYCSVMVAADTALDRSITGTDVGLLKESTACLDQASRIERVFTQRFKKKPACKDKLKRLVDERETKKVSKGTRD